MKPSGRRRQELNTPLRRLHRKVWAYQLPRQRPGLCRGQLLLSALLSGGCWTKDRNLKRKADMFTKRTIRAARGRDQRGHRFGGAGAVHLAKKPAWIWQYMSTAHRQKPGRTDQRAERRYLPRPCARGVADSRRIPLRQRPAEAAGSGAGRRRTAPAICPTWKRCDRRSPRIWTHREIEVRLGATWIDHSYIREFMVETCRDPLLPAAHDRRDLFRLHRRVEHQRTKTRSVTAILPHI